jgi:predicted deacylase
MRIIEIGSARSEGPGIVRGFLPLAFLLTGEAVEAPIVIARGRQEGPVIWIQACLHGNEYCGTFIVQRFLRELDLDHLVGTVVVVPVVNTPAFRANRRLTPYDGYHGGDLNRLFPGRAGGSMTEQMAHAFWTALSTTSPDYLVDFHTAFTADTGWTLFCPPDGALGEKAAGLARAFGYPHAMPTPPERLRGSALVAAAEAGIPALIAEAGGMGASFTEEVVADGAERLRNVLRQVGILPGAVTDYGPITYVRDFLWLTAIQGGLFRRAVSCGDRVSRGAVLGRSYDAYGTLVDEMRCPEDGIVLAIANLPALPSGEILSLVGVDPRAAA